MTLKEKIRKRILKFLKLDENPNSERFTYISNEEEVKRQKLSENKIWYYGDSNELLNYYTNQATYGDAKEPIYNRNKRNYFWGINPMEGNIKRVHSGIPNAIVTTLVNVIGQPNIQVADVLQDNVLKEILEDNDFVSILNQQQMPLTMVEGWGAFKINIDKSVSNKPIIEYYEAEDVDFIHKSNKLIGIIYKDYYEYENRNYVLLETRRIDEGNSYVEYELYRLEKSNEVAPVSLDTIPELSKLQNLTIENFDKILGVPSIFFFDLFNKKYGRSIYQGKVDLFDDLDQILSQDSQTVKVSTPVEYYPVDLLERDRNGMPKMPKVYNRQYVKVDALPNGDGELKQNIQTTQPNLNFDQYAQDAKAKLDLILTGLLSPATMGIDVAKKDNAIAQREKEKVTIMTRNNIIDRQEHVIKDLCYLCLCVQNYLNTDEFKKLDCEISVTFNEFANPSFENELQILGNAWSNGQLSTEKYVELLWTDKLSDEEKQKEIQWLDENKQKDNIMVDYDENAIRQDLFTGQEEQEESQEY